MLEIPQLCACGTDRLYEVIQADPPKALDWSVLKKCSFLPSQVIIKHLSWSGLVEG